MLSSARYESTPSFSLKGENYECKVLDVYDGDTLTLCIELRGFGITKFSCRLLGIDTSEMRGGTMETKRLAVEARNVLVEMISDIKLDKNKEYKRDDIRVLLGNSSKTCRVVFDSMDKYGRPLVCIYNNGIDINQWMINNNYAKKYDGGKKPVW